MAWLTTRRFELRKQRSLSERLGRISTIAAVLACVAPVRDAAADPGGGAFEEIIVTAQKRAESINTVPIAINAFTGDDLQKLGVEDTRDLSKLVPGFSAADSGFNAPIYTLRGVGFTDPSQTSSSTVGIYADEFNLPYPTMSRGANVDVQRVEVLKGPQGTLYGRNTTAGLVNYIANKPQDTFGSGLSVSYGRFQRMDGEGFLTGPLTETLRGRVAAKGVYAAEGWQQSKTRSPDGPYDTLGKVAKAAGRALIDWQPVDSLTVELSGNGWFDRSEPQAPQVIAIVAQNPFIGAAALDPAVRDYPVNPFHTHDARVADWPDHYRYSDERIDFRLHDSFFMPAIRADWSVADATTVTLLADYQRYQSDGSYLPQSGLDTVNSERKLFTTIDAYAFELRGSGQWGDLLDWQVGGNLARDEVSDLQEFRHETTSAVFPTPAGPLLGERDGFSGHQTVLTPAGFGNLDWHLWDAWTLTTGLRYTAEDRKFDGCAVSSAKATQGIGLHNAFNLISLARGGTGGAVPGGCVTIIHETNNPGRFFGSLNESSVGWRFALSWRPNDWMLYYVSDSRAFKSGSFPSINIADSSQFAPVTQERLDAYELGAKLDFLDDRMHVNAGGFYYDYKDKQLLNTTRDPIFGPLPILRNAPKSRVIGAETDVQLRPLDGLLVSLAATYVESEIIEFEGLDPNANPADFAGRPFNFTPKWTMTALVDYTIPISTTVELHAGADVLYRTETNATLAGDPLYRIKAYPLVDARLGVQTTDGRWLLNVAGRNVLDGYYYNNVIRATDSVSRFTGLPATWGITLAYRY